MVMEHIFMSVDKIATYDDIHKEVGRIVKASCEWEKEFKELLLLLNIKTNVFSNSGLQRMNKILLKEGYIDDYYYKCFRKVIERRNYIVHEYFLESHSFSLEENEDILNGTYFLINEARDIIANIIDEHNGVSYGKRPTVFDKEN